MEQTDSGKSVEGGGDFLNEDKGSSQGIYMKDPWTWTTGWGLTVEVGVAGWRRAKGENLGQL